MMNYNNHLLFQGENQEFPSNADPILAAIYSLKGVSPREGEGDDLPDHALGKQPLFYT
jgi:hypothetical protein